MNYDVHEAIFETTHVLQKIYFLSNMFYAESSIASQALEMATAEGVDMALYRPITIMERLRNELFLSSSTTLLVEIAIFIRILDDRYDSKYPIDAAKLSCGVLSHNNVNSPLSLREACNKIIHAKGWEFWRSDYGPGKISARSKITCYLAEVTFWGELGKTEWLAQLDVRQFCDFTARVCDLTLLGHPG